MRVYTLIHTSASNPSAGEFLIYGHQRQGHVLSLVNSFDHLGVFAMFRRALTLSSGGKKNQHSLRTEFYQQIMSNFPLLCLWCNCSCTCEESAKSDKLQY